ncbi:MAG: TIGR03936 family radical SAM-associated protein [Lachnospiraceae bacterium]|nr:TIGR03936 family radical SAM-associated protein [Lachnospiraceae bacterium]
MNYRIIFYKFGVMKFLGHLDIMRYFQKAFKRAKIDVSYSKGYNPHMIMSFASPLGTGLTSDGEYLDVSLNEDIDNKVLIDRLNEQMVDGMYIAGAAKLSDECKNSMSIVAAATYLVSVKDGYNQEIYYFKNIFREKIKELYSSDEIKVIKATKKSEKEVDIKPLIINIDYNDFDYSNSCAEIFDNQIHVVMTLSAGSENNLKPELIIKALCEFCNINYNEFAYQYHRTEMYYREDDDAIKPLLGKDAYDMLIQRELFVNSN